MNLIPFPPRWSSPEAKALYELLQAEMAKAYVSPFPLSSEETRRFWRDADVATASLRAQCVRLLMEHTLPQFLVERRGA